MRSVCCGSYCADANWVDSSFVVKGRLVHTSLISTARKRNWRWNWTAGVMQRKSKLPTMWKGPHTCSIPVFKCYVFGTIKCSKSQKRFCKRYGTHCTLCHPHPNPLPPAGEGVVARQISPDISNAIEADCLHGTSHLLSSRDLSTVSSRCGQTQTTSTQGGLTRVARRRPTAE